MSIFPHADQPVVEVIPIGDPPDRAVRTVARSVTGLLEVDAAVVDGAEKPTDDDGVVESDAAYYLDLVAEYADDAADGDHADLAIGVTDERLDFEEYQPDADVDAGESRYETLYGIHGLTDPGGSASVLSTAPFESAGDDRFEDRLRKKTRRYTGSLLGFDDHEGCVMARADTVDAVDASTDEFCEDCRTRLTDPETAPEPEDWHVTTEAMEEFETAMRWADGDVRLAEYPLIAVGVVVLYASEAWNRLPTGWLRWPGIPDGIRGFVHEAYRTMRFWVLLGAYFVTLLLTLAGFTWLLEDVLGLALSEQAFWVVIVVSLVVAFVVFEFLRAIAGGLFLGVSKGLAGEEIEESGTEE